MPVKRMISPARLLLAALVIAASTMLAAPSAHAYNFFRSPVRSMLEMRQDRVITQSWDLSCGAAVLATLLVHQHGALVTERDVAIGLMRRKEYIDDPDIVRMREGFSLLDMQRYVEELGFAGQGFGKMTMDDLIERAPIIVPVRRHGYNHFVIFRGVLGNRVLIADPSFGTRTLRREQFERQWIEDQRFGRVGFIVTRKDGAAGLTGLTPDHREFLTFF